MHEACKSYLKELRLSFPVFQKTEKRFYNDFKSALLEYQAANQSISRKSLEDKFGTPKNVVIDYFDNMGPEAYLKLMHKTLYIKLAVLLLIIFMIISLFYQTYSISQMRKEARETAIVSEETTIIEYSNN